MNDNKGLGMVEIILILAILIAFVLAFRENLIEWTGYLYRGFVRVLEKYQK